MTDYDPTILQSYATALYRRANSIIVAYTLLGMVIGAVGGWFGDDAFRTGNTGLVVAVCAIMFGALGYTIGTGRAFMLKLRAQEVFCQRQIEMNTRAESRIASPPVASAASYAGR